MTNNPFVSGPRYDYSKTSILSGSRTMLRVHHPHAPRSTHKEFINGKYEEVAQGLPEAAPLMVFNVQDYPAADAKWLPEHGEAAYFTGFHEKKGLWFDFNSLTHDTHHWAIRPSVQGASAITMRPTKQLPGVEPHKCETGLEQYRTKCPNHLVDFEADRYCPACKFRWPGQNYFPTNGTPAGWLWNDGWRAPNGNVYQFVTTLKKEEGVANAVYEALGAGLGELRTFSFGFAFHRAKTPKPVPVHRDVYRGGGGYEESLLVPSAFSLGAGSSPMEKGGDFVTRGATRGATRSLGGGGGFLGGPRSEPERVSVGKMEIGQGALIKQQVFDDAGDVGDYEPLAEFVVVLSYGPVEDIERILAAGSHEESQTGALGALGLKRANS